MSSTGALAKEYSGISKAGVAGVDGGSLNVLGHVAPLRLASCILSGTLGLTKRGLRGGDAAFCLVAADSQSAS